MGILREFEKGLRGIYDKHAEALAEELLDLGYGILSTYYAVVERREPDNRYRQFALKSLAWNACELCRLLCLAYRYQSKPGIAYALRASAEHYVNVSLVTSPPQALQRGPDALDRYCGYMVYRNAKGTLRQLAATHPTAKKARRMLRMIDTTAQRLRRDNKGAWQKPIGDWTGMGWNQERRAKEAGLTEVYNSVYRIQSAELHVSPLNAYVPRSEGGNLPDYEKQVPDLTAQLVLGMELFRDLWWRLSALAGFSPAFPDGLNRVMRRAYDHAEKPGVIPIELSQDPVRQ